MSKWFISSVLSNSLAQKKERLFFAPLLMFLTTQNKDKVWIAKLSLILPLWQLILI
jgi:hypothetical protein